MESGVRQLTEQDLNVWSPTKQVQYGAIGMTEDGRKFRYVSLGGTSTVAPGLLMQAAVSAANSQGLVITAAGINVQVAANFLAGSTLLVVTNSSTAVTQDEFAEGFLEVLQTTGSNQGPVSYRIKGNSAAAASTGYIQVYLAEPLRNTQTLVAATDTVNLWASPFSAVVATTTVNVPIGVTVTQAVNSATVTNYGWVQCGGETTAFFDASTAVIGDTIGPSTTTAGYVGLAVAATKPAIGWSKASNSGTAGGYGCVLNIS